MTPPNVKKDLVLAAIAHQEKLLHKQELQYGEFEWNVSDNLGQLALLYNMTGAYEKALALLHRRLVIHEKFGPEELVGQTLQDLGTTYRLHGVLDIALQHLTRALESRINHYGEKGSKVAETFNSLAMVYSARNESVLAEDYQQKSLRLQYESTEPEDIESQDVPWEVYKRLKYQHGLSDKKYFIAFKAKIRETILEVSQQVIQLGGKEMDISELMQPAYPTPRVGFVCHQQHSRSKSDSAVGKALES
ncbi:hypothetical protein ABG067_003442 [Albugo candida]